MDITKDAQQGLMTKPLNTKTTYLPGYHPRVTPKHDQIERAVELINNAKRPYVLFGHGVLISQAMQEFKEFIEKLIFHVLVPYWVFLPFRLTTPIIWVGWECTECMLQM